tara:strand:+ start:789 stop:1085 length:297 start_codon:yes stop_codon:yes gene_type:complete
MPLRVFELNNSIVCIENADMVVKDPRNPTTKNKYIDEDLLAKKPAIHPITKQPITFTESVPKGIRLEILLFTYSVNMNLNTAPRPPPNAIYRILMIVY